MKKKHLVLIGCGFAGLNCIKRIKKNLYDITIIDTKNHHLFQPLLYQVATSKLAVSDIAMPIREIFKRRDDTKIIMSEVTQIDSQKNQVFLKNRSSISYDLLVIAVGNQPTYYGRQAWQKNTIPLKDLNHSIAIKNRILSTFEKAEFVAPNTKNKKITIAIIGGGPTGVELAGSISEFAYRTLKNNFRNFEADESEILLVEVAPHILGDYPEKLSKKALHYLKKLGVKVLTNTHIKNISKSHIELEDQKISCDLIIWAGGNQVPDFISKSGIPVDSPSGRIIVDPYLSVRKSKNIFAIGDVSFVKNKKGHPLPAIAPVAIQQGIYLSRRLNNPVDLKVKNPFRYFDKGNLATVGKAKAVGVIFGFHVTGFFAWLTWCFIHIAYLVGFRNKVIVLLEWFFLYFTEKRGARVITSEDKNK